MFSVWLNAAGVGTGVGGQRTSGGQGVTVGGGVGVTVGVGEGVAVGLAVGVEIAVGVGVDVQRDAGPHHEAAEDWAATSDTAVGAGWGVDEP